MGLSAEVCESFIRECIKPKELERMAAAITKRLEQLADKAKAKAAKRANAGSK
jgi:hypothetical protein